MKWLLAVREVLGVIRRFLNKLNEAGIIPSRKPGPDAVFAEELRKRDG